MAPPEYKACDLCGKPIYPTKSSDSKMSMWKHLDPPRGRTHHFAQPRRTDAQITEV